MQSTCPITKPFARNISAVTPIRDATSVSASPPFEAIKDKIITTTDVSQSVISNIYITGALYLLAIISFPISMVLASIAAAKDKEHMKNVELARKDERLQNITMRSKAKAFDVISYILPLVTVYLSLSKMVETIASLILGVLTLSTLALQLYYFTKYSKEM